MRGEFLAAGNPLRALAATLVGELLSKHGLRDHEFADHVHKPVHAREIDPDRCCSLRGIRCGNGLRACRKGMSEPRLNFAGSLACFRQCRLDAFALDLQDAILIDKLEDFGDSVIGRLRAQIESEREIRVLWIEAGKASADLPNCTPR